MASQTEYGRSLRHKVRRRYDEGESQDDEIEGRRTFTLDDKLTTDRYNFPMVKTMNSEDFTLKWLQENGFDTPLLFKESTHLDIRVPESDFTVTDVKHMVGSRRMIDVMDVNTQKGTEMSMAQFARYYENTERKELYNVISLECSHTKLGDALQQPKVVRQIDWVSTAWPRHLIQEQRDSTNVLAEMKYPKVQKYCLMSVKGCYTDFHVDFGGTSVWYHLLKGSKVFWLIPPTDENIETYETWVLSGKQGDIFLGDRVLECGRIRLEAGDTFMIPTGWIHAVYTPEDALVFGGNILHTFNVKKQLRVKQLEDGTKVPTKFKYPFYFEIHWYALARYVEALLGRIHINYPDKSEAQLAVKQEGSNGHGVKPENGVKDEEDEEEEEDLYGNHNGGYHGKVNVEDEEEMSDAILKSLASGMDVDSLDDQDVSFSKTKEKSGVKKEEEGGGGGDGEGPSTSSSLTAIKEHIHLCWAEMEGLMDLVEFLEGLPRSRRSVPDLITHPDKLLQDAREMLELHQNDDPGLGVTGNPIVKWPDPPVPVRPVKARSLLSHRSPHPTKSPSAQKRTSGNRKRRSRCKVCENCTRADCGDCNFCHDMKKYGGPGRMKQSCIKRQCLAPILATKSNCSVCHQEDCDTEGNTSLMECRACGDITHPACLRAQGYERDGIINKALKNSWQCLRCVAEEEEEEGDEEEEEEDVSDSGSDSSPPTRGRKRKMVHQGGRGRGRGRGARGGSTAQEGVAGVGRGRGMRGGQVATFLR